MLLQLFKHKLVIPTFLLHLANHDDHLTEQSIVTCAVCGKLFHFPGDCCLTVDRLGTTKVNEGLPLANMVHQTLYTNISHVKYEEIYTHFKRNVVKYGIFSWESHFIITSRQAFSDVQYLMNFASQDVSKAYQDKQQKEAIYIIIISSQIIQYI